MKKKPAATADRSDLRRRAEGRLGASGGSVASGAPEAQRLAHELEVHKTELDLLNEELERTRAKAEEALARYAELYELAPVGYLTLGVDGKIQRVNITGARLLGLDRSKLVGKRFELLVVAADRTAFNAFLARAFESRSTGTSEVLLEPAGSTPVVLELTATASDDGQECRVVATDITDRKRAEQELDESRHLVESIVENVPLMIFLKEAQDLRFVVFNRAGEDLLGYGRDDLLGKNNLDLFPPEQAAFFMAKDREVLASNALLDIPEEPILTAKKGERWLHTRKLCIKGADGVTKYLLGISEDITERKLSEEALRRSEGRLRDIMFSAADWVWEVDENGVYTYSSEKGSDILGYPREEVIGKTPFDFMPPDEVTRVATAFSAIVQAKAPIKDLENWNTRKDGEPVCLLTNGVPILDDAGNLKGYRGVDKDITDRKRAETELKASAEKHRALFESARDAIMTLAPPSWRFTSGNPATIKMFGARDEADLASRAPWEYSPAEQPDGRASADKAREMIETAMATGAHFFEWTHMRLSGETFPATVLLTRMEIGGHALLQATVHDITIRQQIEGERQKLEEQLRVSQKMEAVGSLAGGIAHDFNNLLGVILSYTAFALENVRAGDPARSDLLQVQNAANRAVTLVRHLLAFGRKQVLQPVPLDLNQIALGVEKMLVRIVGEDVEFVHVLAPDLGLTMADPGQIEQVLMILVVNARDAMPRGGRLTIETANVEIDEGSAARHALRPGSYVQLAVTDTGSGMDPQTRARIFEPFFTTKEKGRGTGLGLSTVYGILKQSGGNIWVESEPGRGTTFRVCLPRDFAAKVIAPQRPTVVPRSTGTETVLVVDDEAGLVKIAERTLRAVGYTVLTAGRADRALRTAAGHAGDIHLLLTDVIMPRMNGKALAHELSKTRPALKVLYMSGYTDDAISLRGVLDEGTYLLGKPFTAAQLTRKVREVLDGGIADPAEGAEPAAAADAETEDQPPDEDAIRSLSPETLGNLQKALIAARYDEILALVETVRPTQPALAARLRRMANDFDYDGMQDVLSR